MVVAAVLAATPSFAAGTEKAYLSATGGFATSPDGTSGDVLGELGIRIAPHLLVFGDIGRFHNLRPSEVQSAVDGTTASLSASGLDLTGYARVPAWHSIGGLRIEGPSRNHFQAYALGGVGVARLTPAAQFTYTSGTLPDATPVAGDDVTPQVIAMGDFTQPAASNAFMFSLGGGVEVPMAKHVSATAEYRFSRINADTPFHEQGMTFGLGYRF